MSRLCYPWNEEIVKSRTDATGEAEDTETSQGIVYKIFPSGSDKGSALLVPLVVIVVGCVVS